MLLLNYIALCSLLFAARGYAADECREKGFLQGDLFCSSCALLKDQELTDECNSCCTHAVKYKSAILEVCPTKLSRFPEVKDFIDDVASSYQRQLKVRMALNTSPRLKLVTEDGQSYTIRVDTWKKATFEDFMHSFLSLQ